MGGIKGKWLWLTQRVTAAVLMIDALVTIFWWALHPNFSRSQLEAFLTGAIGGIATSAVLIAVALHGAVGMWAVGTDYITVRQMGPAAKVLQPAYSLLLCVLLPLAVVVYGLRILWLR